MKDIVERLRDEASVETPWPADPGGTLLGTAAREIEKLRRPVFVIFDGPPSHESGRFVEVEDADGKSINTGEWIERPDGLWALRLP